MRNRPDNWDLNFRPPFSEDELAWMRVMAREVGENEQMWLGKESSGALYWKIENQDGSESGSLSLPRELFPQIQPGQKYDVRKVLRENEQ